MSNEEPKTEEPKTIEHNPNEDRPLGFWGGYIQDEFDVVAMFLVAGFLIWYLY